MWKVSLFVFIGSHLIGNSLEAAELKTLLSGHPRLSYASVHDIDAMEGALRTSLGRSARYSFSRGWWPWDRLRCRFVDEGRRDKNALKILRAVFRGLILDWHKKLEAQGEGDLFYIFFTTTSGNKTARNVPDGRSLVRDLHGGGYHGGWGGAARMRIYEELVQQDMLTREERSRFQRIVHQSLEPRFIDFEKGAQTANNHSFGNGGGIALAIKMFPDAPQATEARAWLDRIWAHLADYGDWTEWTYYPYGPIFLHGMLDIAEATGRMESDRDLIHSIGQRCLGFNHGGGVKGNPNSGSRVRNDLERLYADPWNMGYYNVETSGRDGHFWYRLAQQFKNSEYLWAAEQVSLGGQPPGQKTNLPYRKAYQTRFAWFEQNGIQPKMPQRRASVGLLSAKKLKIPERLLLHNGLEPEQPFAAFFLYDQKDNHLDNISGHLYEYSVNGFKFLHTSGKYNNVYSGKDPKGGCTGEESLDLLLVLHKRHAFPVHPDRLGDQRDFMRMGAATHVVEFAKAENNDAGDAFGQFGFEDYYGEGSRWNRRSVLTTEGYLIVADEYQPGEILQNEYQVGPVWHLAEKNMESTTGPQQHHWFTAPAFDKSWWQKQEQRVLLYFHKGDDVKFGSLQQTHSQDTDSNVTVFAYRSLENGQPERFLSVFVPYEASTRTHDVVARIHTAVSNNGEYTAFIDHMRVMIDEKDKWIVSRNGNLK